jgi:hypothetical protein
MGVEIGGMTLRKIFAFLVAPLPAALIQSIVVAIWPKEGQGVFEHPASMFVAMCLLLYMFNIVLGMPAYLALRKKGLTSARAYSLAGMIVVFVPIACALGVVAMRQQGSLYVFVYNIVLFILAGLSSGFVFWAVSRPDRPRELPRDIG